MFSLTCVLVLRFGKNVKKILNIWVKLKKMKLWKCVISVYIMQRRDSSLASFSLCFHQFCINLRSRTFLSSLFSFHVYDSDTSNYVSFVDGCAKCVWIESDGGKILARHVPGDFFFYLLIRLSGILSRADDASLIWSGNLCSSKRIPDFVCFPSLSRRSRPVVQPFCFPRWFELRSLVGCIINAPWRFHVQGHGFVLWYCTLFHE